MSMFSTLFKYYLVSMVVFFKADLNVPFSMATIHRHLTRLAKTNTFSFLRNKRPYLFDKVLEIFSYFNQVMPSNGSICEI